MLELELRDRGRPLARAGGSWGSMGLRLAGGFG
jgi:hypothetical protein